MSSEENNASPLGLDEVRLKEKQRVIPISELSGALLNIAVMETMGLSQYSSIDMKGNVFINLPLSLDLDGVWKKRLFNPAGDDKVSVDLLLSHFKPAVSHLDGQHIVTLEDSEEASKAETLGEALAMAAVKRFYIGHTKGIFYLKWNIEVR